MARKYKPIADSVLIEKMDMPDHTEGGILLPHVAQGDILKGKVIAVGPGMPDIPMFVKPGDVILYYSNKPITVDSYVLINQNCIYVVVEENVESCESDDRTLVVDGVIHPPVPELTPEPDEKTKSTRRTSCYENIAHTCSDIDNGSSDIIATN